MISENSITSLYEEIGEQDWNSIELLCNSTDCNYTYKIFVKKFSLLYNYIPRRKSGIYWIQVRRAAAAAAAAVEISLWTR